jgi:UDP-glucose 4-epimerase
MKKIIVTGALGHIGSALIRSLSIHFPQADILMIDDLSCQRYCSLFNLPSTGKFKFIETDILDAELRPLLSGGDALVHLAAITNAANSFNNPNEVEEVNSQGTERVARVCADLNIPFVFLSTTSVYGSQETEVDEDCPESELKPQSPYADSKLKSEKMLVALSVEKKLRHISLRFGTIVGPSPGMRFHTAVNKFCWQAALSLPISVWTTALDQKRPYLSLTDAIGALIFLLEKKCFDGQVYNVVTENLTVRNIVNYISAEIPNPRIDLVDTRIMNQLSYNVKSDKFQKLGFKFSGDLKSDIHKTIELLSGLRNLT